LLVKNLAWECTADEVREMFKPYGSLKNHRGFGFVEFLTKEEARQAFKALQDTHLYGRKLVIEYAKLDKSADGDA
jgi:multiple RNA-binding domain-containing protein 1